MHRNPVTSSNIASIGHESESRTLEIEFRNGAVYRYDGVPSTEYAGLMSASSHGKYFDRHIKGCYEYRRVR